MRSRSQLSFALAATLAFAAADAAAQPRDHRDQTHEPRDHRGPDRPPPPTAAGPTQAPPAPQAENPGTKAGYVWIAGRWDWKQGAWTWAPGHWERERAGKEWHAGHWDPQGSTWKYTEGAWADHHGDEHHGDEHHGDEHRGDEHHGDDRPHQAPPPAKAESPGAKAGYVWIPGLWDWKDSQWAWTDGHWERARQGKAWRPAAWQEHDGAYKRVDGDWIDEAGAAPPAPAPGSLGHPHHHWKLDQPVVSSYWPVKGKAGTKIVIRGRNFPAGAMVVWSGQPVRGAKVSPEKIELVVPDGATSGPIALRRDHGRDLAVGAFEVAADVDPVAEQKKLDDEARAKAEADWAARQKQLSKDKAARQAELDKREAEREQSREQRRADRVAELRKKWEAAFLADADTQAELTLHAQRVAEIGRMREVAELSNNGKLAVRIDIAGQREQQRHDQRMAALHDAFGPKGGNP